MNVTLAMEVDTILGETDNVLGVGDVVMMIALLVVVGAIMIAPCAGDVVMKTAIIATETEDYTAKLVTEMVVSERLVPTATAMAMYENNSLCKFDCVTIFRDRHTMMCYGEFNV